MCSCWAAHIFSKHKYAKKKLWKKPVNQLDRGQLGTGIVRIYVSSLNVARFYTYDYNC